ncbi:hypothetical protein EJ357_37230 [Streptomyces cyaneochromogenes]|uniref:Transposase IS701-like DDE domain-containing protein n=1 Tax=Streptomyces cyaneochromogenes TaxID=2496836 RepID=A0A3Q9ETC4_9ACTN|nr:hypothetical protein EJ357_37230 [Streptomyces cyaneochromogenes]
MVVADVGYGQNADFRDGPHGRGIGYVVAIRSDVTVHPLDVRSTALAWVRNRPQAQILRGRTRQAVGRHRQPPRDRPLRPRPAVQTAGRRAAAGGRAPHRRPGHPRRHAHLPGEAAALGDTDERHASRRPQPALDRPGADHQ